MQSTWQSWSDWTVMSVEGDINSDRRACSGRRQKQQYCYFLRFLHILPGATDLQHGSSLFQFSRISLDECPKVNVLGVSKPCNMTENSTLFAQICLKRAASQGNIFVSPLLNPCWPEYFSFMETSWWIFGKWRENLFGNRWYFHCSVDCSCQRPCV